MCRNRTALPLRRLEDFLKQKQYPEGTIVHKWVLMKETREGVVIPVIRRWVYFPDGTKTYERHPALKYRHLRDNLKELKNFVVRLNGEDPDAVRVKRVVEFRHAYISTELLDTYFDFLKTQIPSEKHANSEFSALQRYCLNFFIVKLKKPNPLEWHLNQEFWARSLLNKISSDDSSFKEEWRLLEPNELLSAKTLKSIVNAMNRFMVFLHQKRPGEVPPLLFKPISRASFKELEARRRHEKKTVIRKFIRDEHWKVIQERIPEDIKIWSQLAYLYGLRRSEVMALDLNCVRKDNLFITKQLIAIPEPDKPVFGPLKSRMDRKVPHWFCKASAAYNLINKLQSRSYAHPGTLSHKSLDLMNDLGYDYDFHDIRHTWITKAIRLPTVVHRDVQLAAGHVNIETTMAYLHDDRILSDEPFVPPFEEMEGEAS
jgi:integrase